MTFSKKLPNTLMRLSIGSLASNSVVRWWIVGFIGTALDLLLLYFLVDIMRLNLPVATFAAGEFATLMRFVVNDRWVFGHRSPTWKRLWQYHLAVLLSFIVCGELPICWQTPVSITF